ncbi:hypothetical protein STENM327S_05336 [Streptomyces tendae]
MGCPPSTRPPRTAARGAAASHPPARSPGPVGARTAGTAGATVHGTRPRPGLAARATANGTRAGGQAGPIASP